jgi:hypothetical protein
MRLRLPAAVLAVPAQAEEALAVAADAEGPGAPARLALQVLEHNLRRRPMQAVQAVPVVKRRRAVEAVPAAVRQVVVPVAAVVAVRVVVVAEAAAAVRSPALPRFRACKSSTCCWRPVWTPIRN